MNSNRKITYIVSATLLVIFYGIFAAAMITAGDQWRADKAKEWLGEAKNITNDTDKLLTLEKAALISPNEETYLLAGVQAIKLGDNKLAERYLGRVKTAEGYYQLGNAYFDLEKHGLAIASYLKSLENGSIKDVYAALGKSYLKVGDIDKAKAHLAKVQPNDSVFKLLVLLDLGTDDTNVSRETNPANKAVLLYGELLRLGYPQSANTILQQAEADGYLTRDSLITLANRANDGGDYQRAYDYLQRAKTIDPYYPQIYQQLAEVCGKLSKTEEAVQYQTQYNKLVF